MLITLQSNSDADANDFSNFFRETVDIVPNSEVALVSLSYNFENSISIQTGVNDSFSLRVGNDQEVALVLNAGTYTPDTFLAAINGAILGYITTRPYEYAQSFGQIAATSSAAGILTLTVNFAPNDWTPLKIDKDGTADRVQVVLSNNDLMVNSSPGILTQLDATGGVTSRTWRAGVLAGQYPLWGSAEDTRAALPHGYYRFAPQQQNAEIYICFGDGSMPTPITNAPVQVILAADGKFDIRERNNLGAMQTVLAARVAYDVFDTFEIRIDRIDADTENGKIRYFQNAAEIELNPTGPERWEYKHSSKLIPCGAFSSPATTGQIVATSTGFAVANALIGVVSPFTTAGSGYIVGEIVDIENAAGSAVARARVSSVDANGGISATSLQITEHGPGFTVGDVVSFVGRVSGALNASAVVNSVANSVTIATPGTGYTAAAADILLHDGTTTVANAVTITAVGGGGEVTDFTWSNLLPNQVGTGQTLTIVQGASNTATLTIGAIDRDYPSLANVEYSVVADGVDEPLVEQKTAKIAIPAGFNAVSHLPTAEGDASGAGLISTATAAPSDSKEAEQMLVNIDQFQIKSMCKDGGIQKAVAAVPYGERENPTGTDAQSGYFFYEAYNLLYHDLSNGHVENHNQLRVRMTDSVGQQLSQLKHPTTVTLDLRPRSK